jgi:drug/metabolite transporter (DMT)-like permease
MSTDVACIAIVALLWGAYPLVARSSGQGGALGTLILSLAGLVPIAAAVLWGGPGRRPSGDELVRLGIAGAMMGLGLLAFNRLANGKLDASVSIPVADTAMLLVSAVAAMWFFEEPATTRKLIGIGLLVAGIVLLRPV